MKRVQKSVLGRKSLANLKIKELDGKNYVVFFKKEIPVCQADQIFTQIQETFPDKKFVGMYEDTAIIKEMNKCDIERLIKTLKGFLVK